MTYTENDIILMYNIGYTHGIRGNVPLTPSQVLELMETMNSEQTSNKSLDEK